jgi:hypothetical protein
LMSRDGWSMAAGMVAKWVTAALKKTGANSSAASFHDRKGYIRARQSVCRDRAQGGFGVTMEMTANRQPPGQTCPTADRHGQAGPGDQPGICLAYSEYAAELWWYVPGSPAMEPIRASTTSEQGRRHKGTSFWQGRERVGMEDILQGPGRPGPGTTGSWIATRHAC